MTLRDQLLREASDLKSEHGENPEYDRALCELIGSILAKPNETIAEAARRVGRMIGVKVNSQRRYLK